MGNKEIRLKDVLVIFRNGASIKQLEGAEGLPITRIETISNATIDMQKVGYANIFNDKYQDYYLKEGDILLSHINSVTHLGKIAIYNNLSNKLIHGMNLLMLRANKNVVLPKYLYYVLGSKQFKRQLPKITKKSVNQASITITDIGNLKLIIEENIVQQKKIINVLDKADEIRKKKKLANDKLDEFLKSTFISMFGNPIINSKKYESSLYGNEFTISSGGTPSTQKSEYWEDGNISWIGSNMCQNKVLSKNDGKFITDLGLSKSSAKIYKVGTILVALVGATIGKTAFLKFETTTNQNIAGIENNNPNKFNNVYIYYHLQNLYDLFMRIGSGKFKMANLTFVRNLPINIPPIDLQNQFAQIVEKVEAQKQKNELVIEQMNNLFNSLSQRAFNGKL